MFLTTIEFLSKKPTLQQVQTLNHLLCYFDNDIPPLTQDGFEAEQWDFPTFPLIEILNAIHSMGFPCRGREFFAIPVFGNAEENWVYSTGFLSSESQRWLSAARIEMLLQPVKDSF